MIVSPKLLRLSVKQMNKHFVWIQYCQSHHCALTTFGHSTAYPSQPFFVPSPLASSYIAGKGPREKADRQEFWELCDHTIITKSTFPKHKQTSNFEVTSKNVKHTSASTGFFLPPHRDDCGGFALKALTYSFSSHIFHPQLARCMRRGAWWLKVPQPRGY